MDGARFVAAASSLLEIRTLFDSRRRISQSIRSNASFSIVSELYSIAGETSKWNSKAVSKRTRTNALMPNDREPEADLEVRCP